MLTSAESRLINSCFVICNSMPRTPSRNVY